jgi:hypothetical protein
MGFCLLKNRSRISYVHQMKLALNGSRLALKR